MIRYSWVLKSLKKIVTVENVYIGQLLIKNNQNFQFGFFWRCMHFEQNDWNQKIGKKSNPDFLFEFRYRNIFEDVSTIF